MLQILFHLLLRSCANEQEAANIAMQDVISALQAENYSEMQNFDVKFMFIKQNKMDSTNLILDKAKKEFDGVFDSFNEKLKVLYDLIREVAGLMGLSESNLKDRLSKTVRQFRSTDDGRSARDCRRQRMGYPNMFRKDERIPSMNLTPLSFNK